MNFNLIHSKIGKAPIEAYFKEFPKEIETSLDHMAGVYNPHGKKNPPIEGGRLIIEGDRCRKIETTIGTFDITSQKDIDRLLMMNVRFLIKGGRRNDTSTLIKWFPPEIGWYAYFGQGIKQGLGIPHPTSYYITDNIIQWKPCQCPHKSCPYHRIKSGWIEDIGEIYEILGEKDKDPSPQKIKEIFSSLEENLWLREGLSIKFFSQPGRIMGQFLLLHPNNLINPKYEVEDGQRELWNKALAWAKSGASLGIGWLQEAIITTEGTHEDVKSSHFANLAQTPVLTPKLMRLEEVEGYGISEESYWSRIYEAAEVISIGVQIPPTNTPPRQHRLPTDKSGKKWGVLPTHYPVLDVINKTNILDLGKDYYIPVGTIFFFKRYEGPIITYRPIVKKLYDYSNEPSFFGKYTKYLTKVGVGKLNSYWIEKKVTILRFTPEFFGAPIWIPVNYLPQGYDGPDESTAELSPTANFLAAALVYGREETILRWQLKSRESQGAILHALKDSATYMGARDVKVKNSLGDFRPKTKPGQRMGIFSDLHFSFSGDGHEVDWLMYADNTDPSSTKIKADPVEYRRGLEVFRNIPLNQAHILLGTIERITPTCELGSKKLLGDKVKIKDLHEPRGKRFRMAESLGEIKEVLNNQEGEWNE